MPAANWGPPGPRVLATPVGAEFLAYDRASKTMLILNAVKGFPDVLGARNAVLAVEAGLSWAPGLDENMRYGRGYVFGIARSPTYGSTRLSRAVVPC